jgi:hypothetical protein
VKAWQRLSLESNSTVAGCRWGLTVDADGWRGAVVRAFAQDAHRRVERRRRLSWWRWWLMRRRLERFDPDQLRAEDAWSEGIDRLVVEWQLEGRCIVLESPAALRAGPLARLVGWLAEVGDCGGLMDALDGGPLPAGAMWVETQARS